MKMQLQEKPIKFIRSKTDDSVKVGIHYTVEEIILLRSLMTSKVTDSQLTESGLIGHFSEENLVKLTLRI